MSSYTSQDGKPFLVVSRSKKIPDDKLVKVGCNRCEGCKLEYARQWAVRCVHEAQTHTENCFLTLTYAPDRIPFGATILKPHVQAFIRRLRAAISPKRIQFYAIGEYGDLGGRPHYHALIFGHDFADKVLHKRTEAGCDIYTSTALTKLWPYGFSTVGALTFESAAYCARYAMKKLGKAKTRAFTDIDPLTGELSLRTSEFALMSLKRPIGKGWLTRFKSDVYPSDFVVLKGTKQKPPRYYDQQLSETERATIKENRKTFAKSNFDNTQPRLDARREVKRAQIKQLKREFA